MKTRLTTLILTSVMLLLALLSPQAAAVTVTNTNDALSGSLRQALEDANPDDTIVFKIPTTDSGYDATTGVTTINLTSGELLIDKSLTIVGPGATLLTVRRGAEAASRIFDIANSGSPDVTISGLTITNGYVPADLGGWHSQERRQFEPYGVRHLQQLGRLRRRHFQQ